VSSRGTPSHNSYVVLSLQEALDAVRSELETKRNEVGELNKQLAERSEDLGRARSDLKETMKTCRVRFILHVASRNICYIEAFESLINLQK